MSNKEAKHEALRYIDNAIDILKNKAGKKDNFYTDKKYVRMAGNTIYNGVLEALDYKFPQIRKNKGRANVLKYKDQLAKTNKKILIYFEDLYNIAHLAMGYDGTLNYEISRQAIIDAKEIINWATAA